MHQTTSTGSKPSSSDNPMRLEPPSPKQGCQKPTGSAKHVSINNSATYIAENRGSNVKGRSICGGKPTVSFQSLSNNYTAGYPSSTEVQQRRRPSGVDQNLDVINEDDNDSSTVATDLKNSFLSQSSAFSNASSSGDTSFSSSSRLNPIGEHAKSMARQLKMDGIVDTTLPETQKKIRE